MRLIDADALMQSLGITNMDCDKCAWHDNERNLCKRGGDFVDACCAIEDAPTIEERKKGKWVFNGFTKCSECGYRPKLSSGWNFCPNCGADMRGETDETD